jgi:hypothetical protein
MKINKIFVIIVLLQNIIFIYYDYNFLYMHNFYIKISLYKVNTFIERIFNMKLNPLLDIIFF